MAQYVSSAEDLKAVAEFLEGIEELTRRTGVYIDPMTAYLALNKGQMTSKWVFELQVNAASLHDSSEPIYAAREMST